MDWLFIFLKSHSKTFHLLWSRHHWRWSAVKFSPLLGAYRPLSRDGSLSCHTYCDTGPRFLRSHPKHRPFSRLVRKARGQWGHILTRIPGDRERIPTSVLCSNLFPCFRFVDFVLQLPLSALQCLQIKSTKELKSHCIQHFEWQYRETKSKIKMFGWIRKKRDDFFPIRQTFG